MGKNEGKRKGILGLKTASEAFSKHLIQKLFVRGECPQTLLLLCAYTRTSLQIQAMTHLYTLPNPKTFLRMPMSSMA